MLGSIDYMHWEWINCPKAWHGQFGRGDKKYPTIMLEAVASYDLWIWHAFFGVAGANNDLTVLNHSPLFDDLLDGIAPVVPYEVNRVMFENVYYLADGIYPQWAAFVKSSMVARDERNAVFKRRQESARKDVERAFGVLQDQIVRWSVFEQRSNSRLNQMNASSNVEELNQMNASSNVEQLASESKAHLSIAYIFYPKEAKKDNTITVDTSENDTFKDTCGNSNDMCDDFTKHPNQTSTSTSNTSIDSIKGPVSSGNTTGPVSIAKFSKDGINAMIENDPWLIRNVSLILKKWTPNANIMKEDVCTIPVNLRSMKRVSSYARATIDLQADVELKDTILVAIPKSVGKGYTMNTIRVEYEWTPPRCSSCQVFCHVLDDCAMKIVSDVLKNRRQTVKEF
ncbi:ALP1-like protein isoform X1, partial [Tanacetum coccineum]